MMSGYKNQSDYPRSGAFVIQFHGSSQPQQGRHMGWVEQVVSGDRHSFHSLTELQEQLDNWLLASLTEQQEPLSAE